MAGLGCYENSDDSGRKRPFSTPNSRTGELEPCLASGTLPRPALVLCQEKRRDVKGSVRPTSVVWIAHCNVLLRCAPEQLPVLSELDQHLWENQHPMVDVPKTIEELAGAKLNFKDLLG